MTEPSPYMTSEALKQAISGHSRTFVLVDSNTRRCCLPMFCREFGDDFEILEILSAEQAKSLETAASLWTQLLASHADRDALLVNLGGGTVTDLGGFVASCYKRGIDFVNVPTSLLAMVDAALGGKTAVDFNGFKNQIGTFAFPLGVFRSTDFLATLPHRELLSGMAEMIKYGFIKDSTLLAVDEGNYLTLIDRAASIKMAIVAADPQERGQRKLLNFGHTIGHALESHFLDSDMPLRHGEAVALGMCCALWLSVHISGLDVSVLNDFKPVCRWLISDIPFSNGFHLDADAVDDILLKLSQDKKSHEGKTQFVLLEKPGDAMFGCSVADAMIAESVLMLNSLFADA